MSAAVTIQRAYQTKGMEEDKLPGEVIFAVQDTTLSFEQVFKTHFKRLHAYAFGILQNEAEAEEIVQQVFLKLWERKENLSRINPISTYLYRAVHNGSLNYLKHQRVKAKHQMHVAWSMKDEVEPSGKKIQVKELKQQLNRAMQELPEQCRLIFQLSRFEDMKYREIADQLGIAVKTVENQMGKALRLLRVKLIDFLTILFAFLTL